MTVQIPGVNIPGVKIPGVKIPGVEIPGVQIPATTSLFILAALREPLRHNPHLKHAQTYVIQTLTLMLNPTLTLTQPLQYPMSLSSQAQPSSLLGGPASLTLYLFLSPPLSC